MSRACTLKGLKIRAVLDCNTYEKGKEVSENELSLLNIHGDEFHPEWNYSIIPRNHGLGDEHEIKTNTG